ncbi:MAG: flagellar biosynthetic protein FliO [Spirochaetaceae bacterium]|jgi:flagellar protein FliO/FliZ|nr:flagellar biosynthetic protein FliO [Spirochaetaceae bacterium]
MLHAQVPGPPDNDAQDQAVRDSAEFREPESSPVTDEAAPGAQENPSSQADENLLLLDEELPPLSDAGGPSTLFPVLRMVLVLALAAAAVYGLVYFLKRLSRPQRVEDAFLKVLSSVHLGSNRYVHVVLVGSRAYLIGAGDSGVNLVAEIEDRETIDAMILEESKRSAESGKPLDFKKLLRRFSAQGPSPEIPGADSIKKRRERFRRL